MKFYWFLIAALAVWRITHLFVAEDGPVLLLARFRKLVTIRFLGTLLDCFYCLSVWIAAPFAVLIGDSWREKLILWPAISGAAIILNQLVTKNAAEIVHYSEIPLPDKENHHELLRKRESEPNFQL